MTINVTVSILCTTFQILLQAGASLDQPDADGNLPLHIACLRPGSIEQLECVEVLVSDKTEM